MTSSGRLLRAVLERELDDVSVSRPRGEIGGWSIPCVGDDNVVEGRVGAAEARESNLDDHLGLD